MILSLLYIADTKQQCPQIWIYKASISLSWNETEQGSLLYDIYLSKLAENDKCESRMRNSDLNDA